MLPLLLLLLTLPLLHVMLDLWHMGLDHIEGLVTCKSPPAAAAQAYMALHLGPQLRMAADAASVFEAVHGLPHPSAAL